MFDSNKVKNKTTWKIQRKNNYLAIELRKILSILLFTLPLGLFGQAENLENTVWMLGKPDMEQPCQLITDCECCLSQILFMEDGICITIDPCFEGGETYTKGKYKVQNNELSIVSENWLLVKKTTWDPSVDAVGDPDIDIKKRAIQKTTQYFGVESCMDDPFLRDVRDANMIAGKKQLLPTAFQFFQLLKKEGVWELIMKENWKSNRVQPEK